MKPEQWAENRVGELVGVCLCGIRQGLACVTRATRKFPVCSCSRPEPCPGTEAGRQRETELTHRETKFWPAGKSSKCTLTLSGV